MISLYKLTCYLAWTTSDSAGQKDAVSSLNKMLLTNALLFQIGSSHIFFCIVPPFFCTYVPFYYMTVVHVRGPLRFWEKENISTQESLLSTYLMQQALIDTSERFFIRYCGCAAQRPLPPWKFSWEDAATELLGQSRHTWWLRCNNNSPTAHLTSEIPSSAPILQCGPGQVVLFINHTVNLWMVGRRQALCAVFIKRKNNNTNHRWKKVDATPSTFAIKA